MAGIRGFTTAGNASNGGGNAPKVTGTVDGDRIIAVGISDDVASSALTPTTPATNTWTQRLQTIGTGTANGGGTGRTLRVWERTADSDPANYVWDRDGGSGSWMVWTWAIQDLDPQAAIVCAGAGTATGKVMTAPQITSGSYVGDDPISLFAAAAIADNGSSDIAFSTPAGMTSDGSFESDPYLQSFMAHQLLSGHPNVGPNASTGTIATYTNIPWLAAQIVIPTLFATPYKKGLFYPT